MNALDVVKIVVFAILGAFLSQVLKEYKPFLGTALSIITASAVFFFALPELERITVYAKSIYQAAGGKDMYIDSVLKITGIACLTWLGSDILKDAGLSAASTAVVMTGKVVCMGLCLPVIGALFQTLLSILPN